MRNLVYDSGPIQAAFEAGQDATVLSLLNVVTQDEAHKVIVNQTVTYQTLVDRTDQQTAGDFAYKMQAQVSVWGAGNAAAKANAGNLSMLLSRLPTAGIDLTNNNIRSLISAAATAQGYTAGQVNVLLALGYVYKSLAQKEYARDAVQGDIDSVRLEVAQEQLEQEFRSGLNGGINQAVANGDRAGLIAALQALAAELGA